MSTLFDRMQGSPDGELNEVILFLAGYMESKGCHTLTLKIGKDGKGRMELDNREETRPC